jgi:hypothetical protein
MSGRRYPVKDQLSLPGFLDEPGFFDTLETWEQFLAEAEAMPDSVLTPQTILYAEYMIALKKEELDPMPSNLPFMLALIDEPGMFGNTLAETMGRPYVADVKEGDLCVLRTADAMTPFLTTQQATISLVIFCSVYAFIFL